MSNEIGEFTLQSKDETTFLQSCTKSSKYTQYNFAQIQDGTYPYGGEPSVFPCTNIVQYGITEWVHIGSGN